MISDIKDAKKLKIKFLEFEDKDYRIGSVIR